MYLTFGFFACEFFRWGALPRGARSFHAIGRVPLPPDRVHSLMRDQPPDAERRGGR